ncbi:MAG: peptidoglycan-binding protein LysM [Pseudomonadota bacterium]
MFSKLTGLLDFAKDMGASLFTSDAEAAMNIVKHIEANNPGVNPINATFDDGVVTLTGDATSAAAKEKAILLAGNVKGVEKVVADDLRAPAPPPPAPTVEVPAAEALPEPEVQFYVIESGDTLGAIAKEFLGSASRYPEIFEANREVIQDPNKIYPGQKIRIPLS